VVDARVRKRARADPNQSSAVGHPRQLTFLDTDSGRLCLCPAT
jgi:hypothetical protein